MAPDNDLEAIGRNLDALRSIEQRFPRAQSFPCDLSRREAVEALGSALSDARAIPVDLLLCTAATQSQPCLSSPEFRYEAMQDELEVNFVSVCHLIRLLLPRMEAGSVIVLVNSGLAIAPKGSAPIYCASKAALRSLGQSLVIELAPRRIRVLQVYLPLVDTPMTRGRGKGELSAGVAAEAILRAVAGAFFHHAAWGGVGEQAALAAAGSLPVQQVELLHRLFVRFRGEGGHFLPLAQVVLYRVQDAFRRIVRPLQGD